MIAVILFAVAVVYLVIAWQVIKRLKSKKAKWIALIVFVLIPTWDEIIGRVYFQYLCSTEGGITVHKTVALPTEYWDGRGRPIFITANGFVDKERLSMFATFTRRHQDEQNSLYRIRKTTDLISDGNGQIAGEYSYFIHFGGWFINSIGIHVSGSDCPRIEDASLVKLVQVIFVRKD